MNKPITRFVKWLKRTKEKRHRKTRARFYKCLLIVIEVYALALIGMSYYLAYIGQTEVLSDLSQTIVKIVVYPFIAFTINRTVENLAEHNITSFHKPLSEEPKEDIEDDGS
jgi:quinol-cytochrome oxidoreductase complex cytochrome b subunit